jgi:hypothetical protein
VVDPDAETLVFRITQEALTNVTKHAHAAEAEVRLRRDPDRLRLERGSFSSSLTAEMRVGPAVGMASGGLLVVGRWLLPPRSHGFPGVGSYKGANDQHAAQGQQDASNDLD